MNFIGNGIWLLWFEFNNRVNTKQERYQLQFQILALSGVTLESLASRFGSQTNQAEDMNRQKRFLLKRHKAQNSFVSIISQTYEKLKTFLNCQSVVGALGMGVKNAETSYSSLAFTFTLADIVNNNDNNLNSKLDQLYQTKP